MKKRMFNDKARLTKAVLEGRKTMTRSEVPQGTLIKHGINRHTFVHKKIDLIEEAAYSLHETVAVARAYRDVVAHIQLNVPDFEGYSNGEVEAALQEKAGWSNKMYVKGEWMPDMIFILGIDVQRLQDITDEDCIKEGVIKLDDGTFSDGFTEIIYPDARQAFRNIAETAMDAGIWERNPYVYVYEFMHTKEIPTITLDNPKVDELIKTARSNKIVRMLKAQEAMMHMKDHDEEPTTLTEYAELNNLKIISTTSSQNGYPEDLKEAIIGFETFGEAEEAAEAVGGRCICLKKRDGHDFWTREDTAYSALRSEDFRDEDNTIVHASPESFRDREWLKDEIGMVIDMLFDADADLSSLKTMVTNLCESEEKIRNMGKGRIAIMSTETYECETVDEYVMRIHDDDVTTYAIGVIRKEERES